MACFAMPFMHAVVDVSSLGLSTIMIATFSWFLDLDLAFSSLMSRFLQSDRHSAENFRVFAQRKCYGEITAA